MSRAEGDCQARRYALGALHASPDDLFPVSIAADERGGLVAWRGADSVLLRRIDGDGAPVGEPLSAPAGFGDAMEVVVTPERFAVVGYEEDELVVAFVERDSTAAGPARTVQRPRELGSVLTTKASDRELLFVGIDEPRTSLVFFRVPMSGAPRATVVALPGPLPADPSVVLGSVGSRDAVLLTTIAGERWLVDEARAAAVEADRIAVREGPFAEVSFVGGEGSLMSFGFRLWPSYPIGRREEAALAAPEDVAFGIDCSQGFPGEAVTSRRLLFACALAEGDAPAQAVVHSVDCTR